MEARREVDGAVPFLYAVVAVVIYDFLAVDLELAAVVRGCSEGIGAFLVDAYERREFGCELVGSTIPHLQAE